ncbi:polynucleotide kinase 3 phosphatase [Fadolivirus algeromassiliense]|jgi:bifunctional polynucleotide phosphatase/kinase|uniref:Polynucleotide kinase 3 phosphatase n=1 Tax=Fadolivirus FV1/VV64 TaxID=3070911 RepID=A0A7D3QVN7_9VIRU|nr:polynucleotide kinase 3 phosphatase [Fadolivirus algeromassiliense]QKF93966.1 polynucleotide kinase 3 phosphatase [Fadolivirus FV1/VV64]
MEINWNVQNDYIVGTVKGIQLTDLVNNKIAAFDLDDTLIKPKDGKKFGETEDDWEIYDKSIPTKLKKLKDDGFNLVIISNQMGISKGKVDVEMWKNKIKNIINSLGLEFTILCALKDNLYRKPRTGLWELINGNTETSFYCGDAGGLAKRVVSEHKLDKDFSDSDLKFALNVGIEFIHRDEFVFDVKYPKNKYVIDYPIEFSKLKQGDYKFVPNKPEMIINVGFPASGKSKYATEKISIDSDYVYINRDTLKTMKKCTDALERALKSGKSAVIDNTNLAAKDRKLFLDIANKYKVKSRCILFNTSIDTCIHNSYFRNYQTNGEVDPIPKMVYNMMKKKYEKPELDEGFDEIDEIGFSINLDTKIKKMYQCYYF